MNHQKPAKNIFADPVSPLISRLQPRARQGRLRALSAINYRETRVSFAPVRTHTHTLGEERCACVSLRWVMPSRLSGAACCAIWLPPRSAHLRLLRLLLRHPQLAKALSDAARVLEELLGARRDAFLLGRRQRLGAEADHAFAEAELDHVVDHAQRVLHLQLVKLLNGGCRNKACGCSHVSAWRMMRALNLPRVVMRQSRALARGGRKTCTQGHPRTRMRMLRVTMRTPCFSASEGPCSCPTRKFM